MTVSTKVAINSFPELNVLVAQSLGWEKTEFEEECSQFTPGAQWQYGGDYHAVKVEFFVPPDSAIDDEFDGESWFDNYGYVPDFSTNWSHTQLLLKECDRRNVVVNWGRNKDCIGCAFYDGKNPAVTIVLKRDISCSMALTTVLAWLEFQGYDIELDLEDLEQEDE
ncbi:MAG: hypothetical protein KME59_14470 [Trichormus sp. ATA11-4-KO1]|jgi:hypothetical protein|nr:hypothetical protein [Trichormus sp. ATA11-4-KO1]